MRGGALPPVLICAALGIALAFAPRSTWGGCITALALTAACVAVAVIPQAWADYVFLGCWMSVTASAAAAHVPGGLGSRGALTLSLNAGLWSGAEVALSGSRFELLKGLPCVLVILPAALIIRLRAPIVLKVLSSWLIAVAVLGAALQSLPVTPGYMPDHLE